MAEQFQKKLGQKCLKLNLAKIILIMVELEIDILCMERNNSVETKQQIGKTCSIKLTGRKLSSETKNKIRLFNLGKKHSPETKLKMSNSRKGISHPKVTCPHCNKSGGGNSMKRWHFKNCRWRD